MRPEHSEGIGVARFDERLNISHVQLGAIDLGLAFQGKILSRDGCFRRMAPSPAGPTTDRPGPACRLLSEATAKFFSPRAPRCFLERRPPLPSGAVRRGPGRPRIMPQATETESETSLSGRHSLAHFLRRTAPDRPLRRRSLLPDAQDDRSRPLAGEHLDSRRFGLGVTRADEQQPVASWRHVLEEKPGLLR